MEELNKIAYEVRKIRKQVLHNEVTIHTLRRKFKKISARLKLITGGKHVTKMIYDAICNFEADAPTNEELREQITKILNELQSMKVKARIHEVRKELAERNYSKERKSKTDKIYLYDVVMAPTQGGLHYCLVGDIKGDNYYCYPMTTASSRALNVLGRNYVSMTEPLAESKKIYLTDAVTRLSKEQAQKNFVQHTEVTQEMIDALGQVRTKAA